MAAITVSQLLQALEQFPPEAAVLVRDPDGGEPIAVTAGAWRVVDERLELTSSRS